MCSHRCWLGLMVALVAVAIAAYNQRTLYHLAFGPTPVMAGTLNGPGKPPLLVTLRVQRIQPLFAQMHTLGRPPCSWYAWLHVEDQLLLARLPHEHSDLTCTGTLEELSPFEEQHVVAPQRQANPATPILPFRLNMTRPFVAWGLLLLVLPLLGLLGLSFWLLASGWRRCPQKRAPVSA